MPTRTERKMRGLAGWALALTLVGYPLAGMIATVFGWDSTWTSTPFRIGVLLFTAGMLARCPRPWARAGEQPWLLAFTAVYTVRLLYDVLVAQVPTVDFSIVAYLVVVFPALAMVTVARHLDEEQAARLILAIGGAVCTTAVVMDALGLSMDRSASEFTHRLSFEAVNPITMGHTATTTLVAVMALARHRLRGWVLPALPLLGAAALAALLLSGSRGPMLALVVAAVALGLASGNRRIRLGLLAAFTIVAAILLVYGDEWQLLARFSNLDDDPSALQRLLIQSNAITQFLGSPILGSASVELEFEEYPHNLFIETAMALGVVGLVLVTTLMVQVCIATVRSLRRGEVLVPLLVIQYGFAQQFSGAIWGASSFWGVVAVVLGLRAVEARARRKPRPGAVGPATRPPADRTGLASSPVPPQPLP